jgi:hypothetical protein
MLRSLLLRAINHKTVEIMSEENKQQNTEAMQYDTVLPAVAFELHTSIFDVKLPFKMTDAVYETYTQMLEDKKTFGEQITCIRDCTPSLSFIYGNEATEYLRIEVDNRHLPNNLAMILLNKVLSNCR